MQIDSVNNSQVQAEMARAFGRHRAGRHNRGQPPQTTPATAETSTPPRSSTATPAATSQTVPQARPPFASPMGVMHAAPPSAVARAAAARAAATDPAASTPVATDPAVTDPAANPPQKSERLMGDMNGDGKVDQADVEAFVLAVTDRAAYVAKYGEESYLNGDFGGKGTVTFEDINPFRDALAANQKS